MKLWKHFLSQQNNSPEDVFNILAGQYNSWYVHKSSFLVFIFLQICTASYVTNGSVQY